jgi:hypothetical protein
MVDGHAELLRFLRERSECAIDGTNVCNLRDGFELASASEMVFHSAIRTPHTSLV